LNKTGARDEERYLAVEFAEFILERLDGCVCRGLDLLDAWCGMSGDGHGEGVG
jgi:hypothetical protein